MNHPAPPQKTLDDWVEIIRRHDMPIFDRTAQQVIALSRDDSAPIAALAGIVLQDASLTARILTLANAIYYNPGSATISTVTRAVIMLGFNTVLNLCLALSLVDALAEGAKKDRLARELAMALHSATQARALAVARGDRSPEEVFIATLLFRIGELAFWCFSGETGDQIDALVRSGARPEAAQEQILGFRLPQLSRRLIEEWHLTELLRRAIASPARDDERVQLVMLGQRIARCAADQGWHSKEMDQLTIKAAKLTGTKVEEAKTLIFERACMACGITQEFGAGFAARYIPLPGIKGGAPRPHQDAPAKPATDAAGQSPHPVPDHALQLKILRELSAVLDENRCDFNIVIELVMEGIYRGVGTDRVLLALTSSDRRVIRGKHAVGDDALTLSQRFRFTRSSIAPNVLFQAVDTRTPRLVSLPEDSENVPTEIADLTQVLRTRAFMVAPVLIQQHCIGLIYADRATSRRSLDASAFEGFRHFVQSGNRGLAIARSHLHSS